MDCITLKLDLRDKGILPQQGSCVCVHNMEALLRGKNLRTISFGFNSVQNRILEIGDFNIHPMTACTVRDAKSSRNGDQHLTFFLNCRVCVMGNISMPSGTLFNWEALQLPTEEEAAYPYFLCRGVAAIVHQYATANGALQMDTLDNQVATTASTSHR